MEIAMTSTVVIPEKRIAEFVERMQASEGANLQSIILYGSAASGTYNPEFSDLNLLCILAESGFDVLSRIAPIAQWWSDSQREPLIIGRSELERSTDVFSIEMLEIREHYRVLCGEDIIRQLTIPMHLHRAQLEYELREKAILLREQLLLERIDVSACSAILQEYLDRHLLLDRLHDLTQQHARTD